MKRLLTAVLLIASVSLSGLVSRSQTAQSQSTGDLFERRIRPLLVEKCYSCHSTQSKPLAGGLRLDTKAGVLAGGSHGSSLVPGNPEKSLLVRAVRFTDDKLKMPPAGKLLESEIAALVEWIK